MKRLIIDMDDVICKKSFIRMENEFLNTNYKEEDAHSFFINDLIPDEKMSEWVEYFKTKNVYDFADLAEDVQSVLEKLNQKYEVYIVTAYIFRDEPKISGKVLKDKFDYLYEKFPFINPKQYVFTTRKDIIEADIRIDDSVNNLGGNAEKNLLFTAYHNKEINQEELEKLGIIRVNSWKEIESILL